jgi:hypothetical protein
MTERIIFTHVDDKVAALLRRLDSGFSARRIRYSPRQLHVRSPCTKWHCSGGQTVASHPGESGTVLGNFTWDGGARSGTAPAARLWLLTPNNQVQSSVTSCEIAVQEVALEYVSLSPLGYGLFYDSVSTWTIQRRKVKWLVINCKVFGRNRERTIVRFAWMGWGKPRTPQSG